MKELTSKLQFKNYEKGEFSSSSKRTFEQTLNLIFEFPWVEQRNKTSVELTGPSITIENDNKTILKIGHYFSGKFILYILKKNEIYERILQKLNDFEYYLKLFFDNDLDKIIKDCVKKPFVFIPAEYFITKPFIYSINLKNKIRYLLFPVIYSFAMVTLISTGFFTDLDWNRLFFMNLLWLTLNGGSIYLLINYIIYCSDLELIISEGQNEFKFGEKDNLKVYNKQNISAINKYKHLGRRNLWSNAIIFEIQFLNGEIIKFPSLFLTDKTFNRKFNDFKSKEIHRFLAKYNEV